MARSLLFNVLFYVTTTCSWCSAARCCSGASAGRWRRWRSWTLRAVAAQDHRRHETRGARRREAARGPLPGGLQASIGLGDLRPHSAVPRSRAADEARAVLDPVPRLVLLQIRDDPGRPRQGAARRCAACCARPRSARRPGARSSSSRKARDARQARRPTTRPASSCSTKHLACRACRSRSIPGLFWPRRSLTAPPGHHRGRDSRSDPAGPGESGVHEPPGRRHRGRFRGAFGRSKDQGTRHWAAR